MWQNVQQPPIKDLLLDCVAFALLLIRRRSPDTGNDSCRLPEENEAERLRRAIALTEEAQRCANDPALYEKAEELLAAALALAPANGTIVQNYVEFCTEIGTYHLTDGADDAAIRYFVRALKHAPEDGQTWLDLGTACARDDHVTEALRAWQQALVHLPDDVENQQNIDSIIENVSIVARALNAAFHVDGSRTSVKKAIQRILKKLE